MNKKQKMKMLAAVLAAGSLYINSGISVAEAIIVSPTETGTGMTQQSQDNDITIVVEDKMDQNDDTGRWEFNEKTGDTIYDFQKKINFSTTGGKDGNNKKIIVSALDSVAPVVDPEKGLKIKHYSGKYAYLDQNGKVTAENGDVLINNVYELPYDESERFYNEYAPVLDTTIKSQTLDAGSDVTVTTVTNPDGEKIATGITVNGIGYDTNTTEFNKNEPGVGGGDYKGNWQVTDKTTGEVYENTTLDRVESSKTQDGYSINYDIYDTAGNKLELIGAASADKLKEVDNKTITGGNINSETGKITLNKQDGTSFELDGQLADSQLVSGELNKNTGELTLVSEDKYTHEQTTVTVDDVASKENLDKLTETVGAKDTASITESYKDTNYIQNAGNMVNADVILDGKIHDMTDTLGASTNTELHNSYVDTTYINGATNMVDADIKLDEAIKNVAAEAGQHTSISNGDDNIVVTPSETPNVNGGVDYKVSLNDHITLGNITVNKDNSGIIGGLSNTNWDWNKYNNNEYENSSNAATEGQLHGAMQGTVQYDRNENGSVNKGSITLGGEGGTSIHNVAPGRVEQGSMDAVNGGQLYDMQQNMGNRINNLDNRISKVGAGAAALAALHPLDFDPDDKLSFAVGYGNYRGENAAAVGAFYQPNEDTLFSLGGTVGNDENMVNVGVSFKLGQKNHVSNNRVSMAKEIISLRDKVAKPEAFMTQQGLIPQSEIDMDKFFPDVPENHWAYEYVKELARLGIIDGYPDGTFSGDRMMTRYEFAAITYRALQKGVNVDKRMITEFEPELKLIRVDVVAQDKDGNPTIERVRTNEQK